MNDKPKPNPEPEDINARDFFAMFAMLGIVMASNNQYHEPVVADSAYKLADEMLRRRKAVK
jgi:hypothetical protein